MAPVAQPQTLLDFLLNLLRDPAAQAAFQADPAAAMHNAGLDGLCLADVRDALPLVMDHVPASVAAAYDEDVRAGVATTSASVADNYAEASAGPAHAVAHGGPWGHEAGVVEHLNYAVANYAYSYDSHDVTFVSTIDQDIVAGGDVTTTVSPTIAAGAGSVAAGGDITSPVATGAGSVAGDGNMVNGAGTASFGAGDAVGGSIGAAGGGAVSLGGDATGEQHTALAFGTGDGQTAASTEAAPTQIDSHDSTSTTTTTVDASDNSTTTDNSTHTATVGDGSDGSTATADGASPLFAADPAHDATVTVTTDHPDTTVVDVHH